MVLDGGWLDELSRMEARWIGGPIVPEIVVCHDTASAIAPLAAARYLAENSRRVSVHFVVERDGTVTQQVPIYARANHAGRSQYHGREACNGFSIGIEHVNPGRLTRRSPHVAVSWFGQEYRIRDYGIEEVETPAHGAGLWMPYAAEQIAATEALLQALFDEVQTLRDVVSHWYVSPGRKIDTNPLFPLDQLRARALGREEPGEDAADDASAPVGSGRFVLTDTPGDTLNMRRWPSFNPNVLVAIPDGTAVPVIRAGTFDGRDWLRVFYGGQEGWIVANYTTAMD